MQQFIIIIIIIIIVVVVVVSYYLSRIRPCDVFQFWIISEIMNQFDI
jgi:hypothetical protein